MTCNRAVYSSVWINEGHNYYYYHYI